jgi:glucose/arabinose dehydrogenase
MTRLLIVCALLTVTAALFASSAVAAPGDDVRLRRVASVPSPTDIAAPPRDAGRLFVLDQSGLVRVLRDGRLLARPFLDMRNLVGAGGERGLLSIEFAPDYARSRRFYVFYTDKDGDVRVDEFRRSSSSANRALLGSRRRVLFQEHSQFGNHNGGQLHFGPDDLLYASIGDGGGSGDPFRSGQRLDTLLGKVIRIDPRKRGSARYRVPTRNPFATTPGARPEIWAYGLRNPFRFSFDRLNGDLLLSDVGEGEVEEANHAPSPGRGRGANFGWSCFEGSQRFAQCEAPGHVLPSLERLHPENCSIIGGYVVRDRSLGSLYGRYVYSDFCNEEIRSAALAAAAPGDAGTGMSVVSPRTFGEDACGGVYVGSGGGPIFRLVGSGGARRCTRARLGNR